MTDPALTQEFQKGDFHGTSICAQSQIQKATELFGPFGHGWGVRNEEFREIHFEGKPHLTVMQYTAELWYKMASSAKEASYPIASDISLFYIQDKIFYAVSDPTKKVKTDALTKGLSLLGFNADVFLGTHDGSKYLKDQNDKMVDMELIKENALKKSPGEKTKAVKLKISETQFQAALDRIKKGEVTIYDLCVETYDLTQIEQSVLLEAKNKKNGATNGATA